MREAIIRRSEPEDYGDVRLVYSSPNAMAGTLELPFYSEQSWREKLSGRRGDEGDFVACVEGEIVGHLVLMVYNNPRTRHSGHFGIAARDDWQGKGVGTELMRAALDLADNQLDLTRLDLRVYVDALVTARLK